MMFAAMHGSSYMRPTSSSECFYSYKSYGLVVFGLLVFGLGIDITEVTRVLHRGLLEWRISVLHSRVPLGPLRFDISNGLREFFPPSF